MLSIQSGALQDPHCHINDVGILKKLYWLLKTVFSHNYFTLSKSDVVVFSHPRVTSVDGECIDIYTKFFIDDLLKDGVKLTELESPNYGFHKKRKYKFSHHNDWIILFSNLYAKTINVKMSDEEKEKLSLVEEEFSAFFGYKINLTSLFAGTLKDFIAKDTIYRIVFKKIKAKTLYIVVSYFNAPVISAARGCDMEVIELQHGTFSQYHLGYSFPKRKKRLDYFPDKMYVWNQYWKELIEMPIPDSNMVIDKFRFLEHEKSRVRHLVKIENQIVVISQGAIGEEIANHFLTNIHLFDNADIFYKLHPGEFDSYISYPSLKILSALENVTIIKDEIPLYELFASSEYQVGVFSTALYEGVEFGCKTILLNINGIEYMDRFIELNDSVEVI